LDRSAGAADITHITALRPRPRGDAPADTRQSTQVDEHGRPQTQTDSSGRPTCPAGRVPRAAGRNPTKLAVSSLADSAATNRTDASPDSAPFGTPARMADDAVPPPPPAAMSDSERYLFDLNGFLVVRGVLSPDEVAACNAAITAHADEAVARSDPALRNAAEGSSMYGDGPPRLDLGGILEWDAGESRVFKSVLAHPRLRPLFAGILGKGYRLDHIPFVLMNNRGGEGFALHGGTVDCVTGEYSPDLAYSCRAGQVRTSLLGCNVILSGEHGPDNGGFCVVPGSHKSNFAMPPGMVDGNEHGEYIVNPVAGPGDVVLFSEGTVHGARAWRSDVQRRTALYRFAPATCAYGRSYFGGDGDGERGTTTAWPARFYEGLSEAEAAVLEPPYANRLDRPNIVEDGTVELTTRSERKRRHDREVFRTKYF